MGDAVRALADRYLDASAAARSVSGPPTLGVPGYDDRAHRLLARRRRRPSRPRPAHAWPSSTGCRRTDDDADRPSCARPPARPPASPSSTCTTRSEHLRPLRIIGSPVGAIREVFDLMPDRRPTTTGTSSAARMAAVPEALRGGQSAPARPAWRAGCSPRRARRSPAPTRAATWAGARRRHDGPWFDALCRRPGPSPARPSSSGPPAPPPTPSRALAGFLREEYAPAAAGTPDARRRRAVRRRHARPFLGADARRRRGLRLGWDELVRIEDEMAPRPTAILPGASIARGVSSTSTPTARPSRARRRCGAGCRS